MLDAHFHPNYLPTDRLAALLSSARMCGVSGGVWAGVWPTDTELAMRWHHDHQFCAHNGLHFARRGDFTPAHVSCDSSTLFLSHGLHPWQLHQRWINSDGTLDKEAMNRDLKQFTQLLAQHEPYIWAIGETGFDLAPDLLKHPAAKAIGKVFLKEIQFRAFDYSIELAEHFSLPLIIHTRNAWKTTLDRLVQQTEGFSGKIMIHCYGGSVEELRILQRHGIFVSFGGVPTWKKAERARSSVAACPDEILLLETDAPDLPPEHSDGTKPELNTPAELKLICEEIAAIRKTTPETIAALSDCNLFRFLGVMTS